MSTAVDQMRIILIFGLFVANALCEDDSYTLPEKHIAKTLKAFQVGDHYFYDRLDRKAQLVSRLPCGDGSYELVFMGGDVLSLRKVKDKVVIRLSDLQNYSTANVILLDVKETKDGKLDVLLCSIGAGFEVYRLEKKGTSYKPASWINVLCPLLYTKFVSGKESLSINEKGELIIAFHGEDPIVVSLAQKTQEIKEIVSADRSKKINIMFTHLAR